jgi:RNA polymerase sigma-70 factor (ECF subfamily)
VVGSQHTSPVRITVTGTTLLEGLKDPSNRGMWQAYVDRYRPTIVRYARRVGLSAADAEDVAQQTLLAFCNDYVSGKYDRQRGRLRDWLFGIARNQIRLWRRRQQRAPSVDAGAEVAEQVQDEDQLQRLWDAEWHESVLRACLDQVRGEVEPRTFEAFELFATRGWPAERVAQEMGLTSNAVFIAKHRVLKRLRELASLLDESW